MKVRVRYVGGLREKLGIEYELVSIEFGAPTIAALRETLIYRGGPWGMFRDEGVRAAVNYAQSRPGTGLSENDEVTFFPPF
jgi:molybdopterin synthase sulfur carrier subunit